MSKQNRQKSVILGMSGGVDSSVAALLLHEQGYKVKGVALKLWAYRSENPCCSTKDLNDAGIIAKQLGIDFEVIDMQHRFKELVVDYYVKELSHGRTPNPCIVCNDRLKFAVLLDYALKNDYDYAATGHYAGIRAEGDSYHLEKALDQNKDQSYFLFTLDQQRLSKILFPLGKLDKNTVREIARKAEMITCTKGDSQELCFLPGGGAEEFLKAQENVDIHKGNIINREHKVMGEHKGLPFYTIGQRKGIGSYTNRPVYVININTVDNSIMIGDESCLMANTFTVKDVHWISGKKPQPPFSAEVKIRYRHAGARAIITGKDTMLTIQFDSPQRAITPGQAAVFYNGAEVLGGGWIWEVQG